MEALRTIGYLVLKPTEAWGAIAREPTTVDALLRRYILPLSGLAPIATFIGMEVFDGAWDARQGYLVPSDRIFNTAATTFFATIASLFALAAIMTLIAPMYRCKRDYIASLKVAVHGAGPLLLSGRDARAARDGPRIDGRALLYAVPVLRRRDRRLAASA
jgi:hypothetical protein